MSVDYKNWVPFCMIVLLGIGSIVFLSLFIVFGVLAIGVSGVLRWVLFAIFLIISLGLLKFLEWSIMAYLAFSYNGNRKLAKQIVEGTADYIALDNGGRILDVGCGSGALSIAIAKRNPESKVVGVDRWGAEYYNFSNLLCMKNAKEENVDNVEFQKGDAKKLPFEDGSFDAVASNYVYHNIVGANKQELLLETLRCLKKGGVFAIHDLMSEKRYGDMNEFRDRLLKEGYEKVELIDTTNGKFMTKSESKRYMLTGSTLLVGKK